MAQADKVIEGKLLVITAPSGAGKTTIVRHLLGEFEEKLAFSVSATTRAKRAHEVDGHDYYFISPEEFQQRISNGEFLEWEEVYPDQYYGTLLSEINRIWHCGKQVVFDIEVKGATNIKERYGDQATVVFIRPPSLEVLIKRLTDRRTESEESLKRRVARMREEMTYEGSFDIVLVNDDLEVALYEAELIVNEFIKPNDRYGN